MPLRIIATYNFNIASLFEEQFYYQKEPTSVLFLTNINEKGPNIKQQTFDKIEAPILNSNFKFIYY